MKKVKGFIDIYENRLNTVQPGGPGGLVLKSILKIPCKVRLTKDEIYILHFWCPVVLVVQVHVTVTLKVLFHQTTPPGPIRSSLETFLF